MHSPDINEWNEGQRQANLKERMTKYIDAPGYDPQKQSPAQKPCPPAHHLKCNNCDTDLQATYDTTHIDQGAQTLALHYCWCPRCLQGYLIPQALMQHHSNKQSAGESQ